MRLICSQIWRLKAALVSRTLVVLVRCVVILIVGVRVLVVLPSTCLICRLVGRRTVLVILFVTVLMVVLNMLGVLTTRQKPVALVLSRGKPRCVLKVR